MDTETPAPQPFASLRLESVDALRGFDMFWIIGGNSLVVSFITLCFGPMPPWLAYQFDHVRWEGFSAWDLIMPLFLFVSGVSMPFSFSRRMEGGKHKAAIYGKVLRRFVILFILGMAAQGRLLDFDLNTLHVYCNTLQSIAAGYLIAAIIMLNLGIRGQLIACAGLLIGFWGLMMFVPVPGYGAGMLEESKNLAMYVDEQVLGRFRDGTSYTWVLSSLTFGASVLLGVFGGHMLRANASSAKKLGWLLAVGVGCLAVGWVWGLQFPIIKHIWTSSMTLWAAGWSFLLLAFFYGVIDVVGFRFWAFPFKIIGMNAIFIYMATHLLDWQNLSDSLVYGVAKHAGAAEEFIKQFAAFLLIWLILLYMYRKKTFIRV